MIQATLLRADPHARRSPEERARRCFESTETFSMHHPLITHRPGREPALLLAASPSQVQGTTSVYTRAARPHPVGVGKIIPSPKISAIWASHSGAPIILPSSRSRRTLESDLRGYGPRPPEKEKKKKKPHTRHTNLSSYPFILITFSARFAALFLFHFLSFFFFLFPLLPHSIIPPSSFVSLPMRHLSSIFPRHRGPPPFSSRGRLGPSKWNPCSSTAH